MPLDEPDETVSTRVLIEVELGRYVAEQMRVYPKPAPFGDGSDDLPP
jgi:hypothetical protein